MVNTHHSHQVFSAVRKMKFIQLYLSSNLGINSFCKENNLSHTTFRRWLRTFAPESEEISKMGNRKKGDELEEIQELKRQLRLKEVELHQERMRADFYETMVDVAEEQFNISIRKKAGTKQ